MAAAMEVEPHSALEEQKKKHPELSEQIDDLIQFHGQKLYHQLCEGLLAYLNSAPFLEPAAADELAAFFQSFLKPLEQKFDKVKFVKLLGLVTQKQDPKKALELIAPFESSTKDHRDSRYMWQALKAEKLIGAGSTDEAKELLDTLSKEILVAYEVHAQIQSQVHKTNALLWKALGRPQDYFRSSILYLTYTPFAEIPEKERPRLAFEIGVSALIAPEEFEFGELVQQDLLTSLDSTENEWLKELLQAFSEGKFALFDAAVSKHKAKIDATPELKGCLETVLRPKMCALALLELAFRKPKKQRRLSFEELSEHCRVTVKEVEFLVMKAMCANLIKGQIDEVQQCVMVTWCKPRILDNARIDLMRERMDAWGQQSDLLLKHLEDMTPELLIS
mmetsp:Transcript_15933/g.34485  ORF Transcript_15933/g.34485 Transcript_15933/m.34485 type:complete len:391 (+) Transcript_15933:168-1340(+)|eukprot:CAMPEP_0206473376 /NCGR_PEP_ID=MMETSP0324_2-20121206/32825_1 /ASSEMBLY_ACC=CAM_ASM_000836 /TAXON_ID=2866 /ORGANISM="Crypthecodinium cohnii, Strain Seligo" /LENGTH=390 /DNA_ID=CAMNT_0053948287 /DNA_START=151 /DNA_END=1323 /DNA_ORIENTATION=-